MERKKEEKTNKPDEQSADSSLNGCIKIIFIEKK